MKAGRRILLVDDAVGGRAMLAAVLEDAGYCVVEAGSLAEAGGRLGGGGPFGGGGVDRSLPDGRGTHRRPQLQRSPPGTVGGLPCGASVAGVPGGAALP